MKLTQMRQSRAALLALFLGAVALGITVLLFLVGPQSESNPPEANAQLGAPKLAIESEATDGRSPDDRQAAAVPGTAPDGTVIFQISRPKGNGSETATLATADGRVRRSTKFSTGQTSTQVAWDAELGPPGLLVSDRRAARALPGTGTWPPSARDAAARFELPDGLNIDCRVPELSSGPVRIVCRTPGPWAWVHWLGDTNNRLLRISGIGTHCSLRAIDPIGRRVSQWRRPPADGSGVLEFGLDLPARVTTVRAAGGGHPVHGALVESRDDEGHVIDRAVTLDDGRAFWHALRPTNSLAADAPGHAPVQVAADARPQRVELREARSVLVRLFRHRERTGKGLPLHSGSVHWSGPWTRQSTVKDGEALLRDLPVNAVELQLFEGAARSSTTLPAEVPLFEWVLAAATTLRGRLTCRWPIDASFAVLIRQKPRGTRSVFPDESGFFEAGNVPDEDLELAVVAVLAPGREIIVRELLAHPGRFVEIDLTPEDLPGSSLSGTVRDAAGAVVNATMRLHRIANQSTQTKIDHAEEGRFHFEFLQTGEYELEAQPLAWPIAVRRQLTIAPGAQPPLDWTLPETVDLSVRLDPETEATREARLGLRRSGGESWTWIDRDAPQKPFVVRNLPPGRYAARIGSARSLAPWIQEWTVPADVKHHNISMAVLPGLPCDMQVYGLDWGETECRLTATSRDGRFVLHEHKYGDSSRWQVTLAPGVFDLEFRRGGEVRRSTVEVADLGNTVHLTVHAW